jgi:dTDP-4-dehydrorhamnose reductase
MKILITGSNGLLGQKIAALLLKKNIQFLASSKGENRNPDCPKEYYHSLDICNELEIESLFSEFKPTHVIHTAAITNVDYCELNPAECNEVNYLASMKLFHASKKLNAHFQLLSTDFVFDGLTGNYSEEDEVGPLSVYAHSKVNAENGLKGNDYKNWSIVRTIIVYGVGNNLSRSNIICWAKDALSKNQEMHIVDDQFRAPTWADDLAWACIQICNLEKTGVFHIAGPETMSIFSIVERVANHFNFSKGNLKKSSSKTLNQPAKRPPHTGFNLAKAKLELGYVPKSLEETLDLI